MLAELKKCNDIYDISDLLEIPAKILTFLLYTLHPSVKYASVCISKKNGAERHLLVPEPRLMDLQRKLSNVLYDCQDELHAKHGRTRSYGFERGRDIYDNALCHHNKRWVFNIDITDFFASINYGRVISYFKKNKDFALNPKIATYVAQIVSFNNQLPQGAPTSPVVSNLICGSLDYRLAKFASKSRCDYSRYADDITFSTNLREFPTNLAVADSSDQGWLPSNELISRISSSGFAINPAKTRMGFRDSRQMVTGLVVNHRPSVPREYYKNTRAAVHSIIRAKPFHIDRFCDPFRLNCEDQEVSVDDFSCIEGRISHCFGISDRNDKRREKDKFFQPSAVGRTYADLLFYKYFVRGTRPIILTEGPSDVLYLKAALKSVAAPIPNMADIDADGDRLILLDFFKFAPRPSRILGLSGGSGNLGLFIERYHKFLRRLSKSVPRRPFIIVLDNDDGLKGAKEKIQSCFGLDISQPKNDDFFQFTDKGYIVKTPHLPHRTRTCIEDFLDPKALAVPLGGKSFSPDPNYDSSLHFGKMILSHHIYEQRSAYSFAPLQPLLNRIRAAIAAAYQP
jgi:RNA-directed DNA polymerase